MRESIGATWILGIVLVFITLFSGYLAFSVNYSKAFRVKDAVIERIEKHSGVTADSIEEIQSYVNEVGYSSRGNCSNVSNTDLKRIGILEGVVEYPPSEGKLYNICIEKVSAYNPSGQLSSAYYKVTVFFSFNIPILNFNSAFHVDGETANIIYPKDEYMR